ncbi:MAG: pilus assembly protein [Sphingomonadales bacterium]|nr:pilus assembly protein [Sphingomonadales bacterium]MBU3991580.1 pilus assembly protein [Alphaproteobacteria bacterium]
MARTNRKLLCNTAGAAMVEFALIAPVLLMLLFGTLEFGLNVYLRAVLEGAMQQAGRNSSLETAQSGQSGIDAAITAQMHNILPNSTVTFQRQNYANFAAVGRPEDFTDSNGNGVHDAGECFLDINGNSTWDADAGRTGIGGANDVVEYTATVDYESWIPVASALRIWPTTRVQAKTLLRNQPFATQPSWPTVQVCS